MSVTSSHTFSRNTKIVNISSVIEQVSYSSHSTEEKEKIKSILEELNKGLDSKPLPGILDNLKEKFKDYFPLASPFIQQIIGREISGLDQIQTISFRVTPVA